MNLQVSKEKIDEEEIKKILNKLNIENYEVTEEGIKEIIGKFKNVVKRAKEKTKEAYLKWQDKNNKTNKALIYKIDNVIKEAQSKKEKSNDEKINIDLSMFITKNQKPEDLFLNINNLKTEVINYAENTALDNAVKSFENKCAVRDKQFLEDKSLKNFLSNTADAFKEYYNVVSKTPKTKSSTAGYENNGF